MQVPTNLKMNFCENQLHRTQHKSAINRSCLYQCESCQALFTSRLPTKKQISEYYNNEYSKNRNYAEFPAYKKIMKKRSQAQLKYINKYVTLGASSAIYDYGAGYGYFLRECSQRGLINLFSTEADPQCLPNLNKYSEIIDIDEISEKRLIFDLSVLSHVLEHAINPLELLSRVVRFSRYTFIELPLYNFNYFDDALDQEGHLWFPNFQSLECMLNKIDSAILAIDTAGPPSLLLAGQKRHDILLQKIFRKLTGDYFLSLYGEYRWSGCWLRAIVFNGDV
jgi:hypothetical protein